jgi:hypothetical protein
MTTAERQSILEAIAQKHLRLETLETRKMDSLDFSDQAVWSIEDALIAAFEAGRHAWRSANAARQQRYRERKAGRLPPVEKPACIACGIFHRKAHGDLCARCWERLTPEGRKARSERVKRSVAKKRSNPTRPG